MIFQGFPSTQRRAYERRRRILLIPLVALLCFSLVMMGGLMWVDNTWAYIGGGQTEDAIPLESLLDGLDYEEIQQFDADGDGMIPLAGGVLLRCNGDQDDNKEERVIIQLLAGETVSPFFSKSATNYDERRTVTAYKDFGHLKVMPASDEVISNIYILL